MSCQSQLGLRGPLGGYSGAFGCQNGSKMAPKCGQKASHVTSRKQCSRLGGSPPEPPQAGSKMELFFGSLSEGLFGAIFVAPLAPMLATWRRHRCQNGPKEVPKWTPKWAKMRLQIQSLTLLASGQSGQPPVYPQRVPKVIKK